MRIFYTILFASLILLSSCTKEPEQAKPQPTQPASVAVMMRTFTYPNPGTTDAITYTLSEDSITIAGKRNQSNQLLLSFDVPMTRGRDYVKFTIDADKIKAGYVGAYPIVHSELSGLKGDAQVNYGYKRDVYSYTEYYPGNADGELKITAYDIQSKLLSGTYTFHINSYHDPKVGMNWVETKIDVTGSFENLHVR